MPATHPPGHGGVARACAALSFVATSERIRAGYRHIAGHGEDAHIIVVGAGVNHSRHRLGGIIVRATNPAQGVVPPTGEKPRQRGNHGPGHEPDGRVAEREHRLQQRERPHLSRVVAGIGRGSGATEGMPNNMRPAGCLPGQNPMNSRSLIGHICQGGGLDRQARVPQRVEYYHPVMGC